MVQLSVDNAAVELRSYGPRDTVADLRRAMEEARRSPGLKTRWCYGCGECCSDSVPVLGSDLDRLPAVTGLSLTEYLRTRCDLPEPPDLAAREQGIHELQRDFQLSAHTATLLYEYNQAEPITLKQSPEGTCLLLSNNLCGNLSERVFVCGLYICTMAPRLEALYDQIVRQGVWHSYQLLGWVPAEAVTHNPFLGTTDYGEVPIRALDYDLSECLDALFFYF